MVLAKGRILLDSYDAPQVKRALQRGYEKKTEETDLRKGLGSLLSYLLHVSMIIQTGAGPHGIRVH